VPCLSSSLDYIDSYFTGRLPTEPGAGDARLLRLPHL